MGNHHSSAHTSSRFPRGLSSTSSSYTSSSVTSPIVVRTLDPTLRSEDQTFSSPGKYGKTTLMDIFNSSAGNLFTYLTASDCLALYLTRKDKGTTTPTMDNLVTVTENSFPTVQPSISSITSLSSVNYGTSAIFFDYLHKLVLPSIEYRVIEMLELRNTALNHGLLSLPTVDTSNVWYRNFLYKREQSSSWFELAIDTEEWYRIVHNTVHKGNTSVNDNTDNTSILSPILSLRSTSSEKNTVTQLGGDRSLRTLDRSTSASSLMSITPSSTMNHSISSSLSFVAINSNHSINLGSSSISVHSGSSSTDPPSTTGETIIFSTFTTVPTMFRTLCNLVLRERIYYRRYFPFYSIYYIGALAQDNNTSENSSNNNDNNPTSEEQQTSRRHKNRTEAHPELPNNNGTNVTNTYSSSNNSESWPLVRLRLVDWIRNLCSVHGLPRSISYDAIAVADRVIGNTKGPLDCLQVQLLYLVALCTVVSRHGYGSKIINRFKKCTNAYTDADYRSMEIYIESNLVRRTIPTMETGSSTTAGTTVKSKRKETKTGSLTSSTPSSPFLKEISTDSVPFRIETEPSTLALAIDEISFTSIPIITETVLSLLSNEFRQQAAVHVDHLVWIAQREYSITRWSNIAVGVAIAYLALRAANMWDGSELISNTSTYWLQIIFETLHIDFVSIRDISILIIHYAGQGSLYSKLTFNFPYKLGKLPIVLHVPGNENEKLMEENMETYFAKLHHRHYLLTEKNSRTSSSNPVSDTSNVVEYPGPNISLLAYNFALQATLPGSYVPQVGLPDSLLYPILRYYIDLAKEPPVFTVTTAPGSNTIDNENTFTSGNSNTTDDEIDAAMDSASLQLQRILLYEQLETIQPTTTAATTTTTVASNLQRKSKISTVLPVKKNFNHHRHQNESLLTPVILEMDDENNNNNHHHHHNPTTTGPILTVQLSTEPRSPPLHPSKLGNNNNKNSSSSKASNRSPPRQNTLTRKRSASAVLIMSGDDNECELKNSVANLSLPLHHRPPLVTPPLLNTTTTTLDKNVGGGSNPSSSSSRTRAVTSVDTKNTPLFVHSHSHHHIHPQMNTVLPSEILPSSSSLLRLSSHKPVGTTFQRLRPFHSTEETIITDSIMNNTGSNDVHLYGSGGDTSLSSRSIRQRFEYSSLVMENYFISTSSSPIAAVEKKTNHLSSTEISTSISLLRYHR